MQEVINQTKVVATLGPASGVRSVVRDMVRAGLDVARVNFAFGTLKDNLILLGKVREVAEAEGVPLAIMQDLQGRKMRVGVLPGSGMELVEGLTCRLGVGLKQSDGEVIPIPDKKLSQEVGRGDRILLNGGQVELEVQAVEERLIVAKILLGGRVLSGHGVAVPTAGLSAEMMTEKDERDLALSLRQGVDWVALSFVRVADDVVKLKEMIAAAVPGGQGPKVMAKIEKHEALTNFDEILEVADGIMIARGDLGLATPLGSVPVVQKELTAKCIVAGKPVVVATQMMLSMTNQPRPTRAEVSDVANAVLDHADAVMLSEETALGKYPVRAVEQMVEVISQTEEVSLNQLMPEPEVKGSDVQLAAAAAAVRLAYNIAAKALVVTTHSGYSAGAVARFRPTVPLYAATDDSLVQRQLSLNWGVTPLLAEGYARPEEMMKSVLENMKRNKLVSNKDKVVVVSGLKRGSKYDSGIRVIEL